jgi:hypothetical protein
MTDETLFVIACIGIVVSLCMSVAIVRHDRRPRCVHCGRRGDHTIDCMSHHEV